MAFSTVSKSTSSSPIHNHNYNWNVQLLETSQLFMAGRERRGLSPPTTASSITRKEKSDNEKTGQTLVSLEELARQKRTGQAKQRLEKSVRREERILMLEMKMENHKSNMMAKNQNENKAQDCNDDENTTISATNTVNENEMVMTEAEIAELNGLLKTRDAFEEQYDPLTFTEEHVEFKAMHNDAFISLLRYCEQYQHQHQHQPINAFFLDGPDSGTINALMDRGNFNAKQCYVANRHESTVDALRVSGGGRLPDENVVHATAAEALSLGASMLSSSVDSDSHDEYDEMQQEGSGTPRLDGGAFSKIDFRGYYFDGCGGYVPHIVNMISAALLRDECDNDVDDDAIKKPIAVGYSLLGGNKNVVEKELTVSRALATIARKRGMRMVHVLDDPARYNMSPDIKKVGGSGGGTFTTWLLLEPIDS